MTTIVNTNGYLLTITVDGNSYIIRKATIELFVDEPYIYVYYFRYPAQSSSIFNTLKIDFNDVAGATSASDVKATIEGYLDSAGGGAVDSVNGQTGVVVLDTGDISEVTDKNYVTDAELVVIGNTSGTNTGDQTLNGLLPSQTGNAGKVLQTDGTNTSWQASGTPSDASSTVKGITKLSVSPASPTDPIALGVNDTKLTAQTKPMTINGNGGVIQINSSGFFIAPKAGTITTVVLEADITGSIVIDIKKNGTSMVGAGNKPTLSSATSSTTTPSGWTTTSFNAGDKILLLVDSASTLTYVSVNMNYSI